MKTKYWILLMVTLLVVSVCFSIPTLLPTEDARYAEIISTNRLVQTVDLNIDCQIPVTTPDGGKNIITVQNGNIGVTEANCPDHYCMDRGMCRNGAQIICLPNRLIIRFAGSQEIDSIAG